MPVLRKAHQHGVSRLQDAARTHSRGRGEGARVGPTTPTTAFSFGVDPPRGQTLHADEADSHLVVSGFRLGVRPRGARADGFFAVGDSRSASAWSGSVGVAAERVRVTSSALSVTVCGV